MLQHAKTFFGDNQPWTLGSFGKTAIENNIFLKLSLPFRGVDPQQQNDAEMDLRLNLLHDFELVEALSS